MASTHRALAKQAALRGFLGVPTGLLIRREYMPLTPSKRPEPFDPSAVSSDTDVQGCTLHVPVPHDQLTADCLMFHVLVSLAWVIEFVEFLWRSAQKLRFSPLQVESTWNRPCARRSPKESLPKPYQRGLTPLIPSKEKRSPVTDLGSILKWRNLRIPNRIPQYAQSYR